MRRRTALVLAATTLLVAAAAAPAKEGTMFDPRLGALTPGTPTNVKLLITPLFDQRGIEAVPAPRPRSTAVIRLRSDETGEVVQFTAKARPSEDGSSFSATTPITIPLRRTPQTWTVSVHAEGRAFPDPMGDKVYVQTTTPAALPASGGGHGRWSVLLGIGAALIVVLGGGLLVRGYRGGGDDANVAATRPTG